MRRDMQEAENMLRRYKGQSVDIKTVSGGVYEGTITEVSNDYVALSLKSDDEGGEPDQVYVLLHSIESVLPRGVT
jgi:ferredoxin-fold anticodon binding domain-containing protein